MGVGFWGEVFCLPLRIADAVDEGLDVGVLGESLGPVPRISVGSCLVLFLLLLVFAFPPTDL